MHPLTHPMHRPPVSIFQRPLKHKRYPLAREKRVTVCIAAACEGGKKLVSATDGLLTLGGITADVLLAKMTWFDDWLFLYAGATSNVGLILEELRQILVRDPEMVTREHIQ